LCEPGFHANGIFAVARFNDDHAHNTTRPCWASGARRLPSYTNRTVATPADGALCGSDSVVDDGGVGFADGNKFAVDENFFQFRKLSHFSLDIDMFFLKLKRGLESYASGRD
jgi:hypothetical protein